MTVMSREAGQAGPSDIRPSDVSPSDARPSDVRPADRGSEPVLPVRSADDTDVGWGERAEQDDDERFRRDRPPHWDSA